MTAPPGRDRAHTERPGSPGSGLGVAPVRQHTELHSGTAELIRRPYDGTRLPVRIAERTG